MALSRIKYLKLSRIRGVGSKWFPVLMSVLVLIAWLGGADARDALMYDRAAVTDGEWWRLVSAHFLHVGLAHFIANLCGLWVIWILVGQSLTNTGWMGVFFVSAPGITGALLFLHPSVDWYLGLSGVLYALIATGIVISIVHTPIVYLVAATCLLVKLIVDHYLSTEWAFSNWLGAPVLEASHFYGTASGGIIGCLILCSKYLRRQPPAPE